MQSWYTPVPINSKEEHAELLARLLRLTLVVPEPREAFCGAEFPGLCFRQTDNAGGTAVLPASRPRQLRSKVVGYCALDRDTGVR
jgi:hypothetical protein